MRSSGFSYFSRDGVTKLESQISVVMIPVVLEEGIFHFKGHRSFTLQQASHTLVTVTSTHTLSRHEVLRGSTIIDLQE